VVPGFDGEDERRGNYTASIQDLSSLIIKLMRKRSVDRIVFCGHSMGSIFMVSFITHYPQYIDGVVSITGIVDTWYIGLLTFYNAMVVSNGLSKKFVGRYEILNDNNFRQ
jgi:pimeloyl-ACP methyl ester carboxylesterase